MRYSPALYAQSLYESLGNAKSGDQNQIIKNFWLTVIKNGDDARIDSIVKAFEIRVVKMGGGKIVEVETARAISIVLDDKIKNLFDKKDVVRRKINSRLVAGIRIEIDGEREIDLSLATKLRKMFSKTV
ncbi:MAG: F0F1 ATP synthase subunit delta [Candidatus Vogelbacteria bacterium]|nr:F0F1 ATP synthase subunit delta [Candidatus Vogelbacteria bacterium]